MGGRDKALLPLAGRPLITHAIERVRPQVDHVLINTHRDDPAYAALGYPLIGDTVGGQPGPLAGLLSGLLHAPDPLVLTVPCDMPLLPADLVPRLAAALEHSDAEVATVHDGARRHQAILLAKRTLAADVRAYLDQGQRKVEAWLTAQRYALADFSDCPEAFANANTPEELVRLEKRLWSPHAH
jgi:molybdopterin-guanine dinucleotide biosynthesis protein A